MSESASGAAPKRSRGKALLLIGITLAAAVALAAATQMWVSLDLADGAAAFDRLEVTGQQLNPSLSPVALAALASALALTIAGPWLRRGLGVLVALLGAGVFAISLGVLSDPWGAATVRLAEVTGLAGGAQPDLIVSGSTSPFIAIALGAGAALVLLGLAVVVLGGRWRTAGRKYQSGAGSSATVRGAEPDRISEWDELSGGLDPTGGEEEDGDEPGGDSPESAATR